MCLGNWRLVLPSKFMDSCFRINPGSAKTSVRSQCRMLSARALPMSNTAAAFCWNLPGTQVISPHQKAVHGFCFPALFPGEQENTKVELNNWELLPGGQEIGEYLGMCSIVFGVWQWHGAMGRMLCERCDKVLSPNTFGLMWFQIGPLWSKKWAGQLPGIPLEDSHLPLSMARSERVNIFPYQ